MSFSDHKITQFTHRITDLPDQPNLPADELKARFDSSPEELRTAHNAVCDDAQTLSNKVDSIITQTFEGVVDKSMLAESLADELDAKAEAADLTAEQTARANADSALSTRVTTLETELPQKVEIYVGSYSGSGTGTKTITLPFTPKAVLVSPNGNTKARLITPSVKAQDDEGYYTGDLDGNKLNVYGSLNITNNRPHSYIAFV